LTVPQLALDRRPEGPFISPHVVEVIDARGDALGRYSSQLKLARAILDRKIVLRPGDAALVLPPKAARNVAVSGC
jgi:hypothetical protein